MSKETSVWIDGLKDEGWTMIRMPWFFFFAFVLCCGVSHEEEEDADGWRKWVRAYERGRLRHIVCVCVGGGDATRDELMRSGAMMATEKWTEMKMMMSRNVVACGRWDVGMSCWIGIKFDKVLLTQLPNHVHTWTCHSNHSIQWPLISHQIFFRCKPDCKKTKESKRFFLYSFYI